MVFRLWTIGLGSLVFGLGLWSWTWVLGLWSWTWVLNLGHELGSLLFGLAGFGFLVFGLWTLNSKLETRNSKLETRNSKLETRNSIPDSRVFGTQYSALSNHFFEISDPINSKLETRRTMETFFRDLRFSLRMLFKNPAFTAVAVLSLALGIGANTTVFSVINTVLLKSLPYNEPESLVLLWGDTRERSTLKGRNQLSATDAADYRGLTHVFEEVGTFTGWNPIMSGDTQAERIPAIQVGEGFFKVMKGTPVLGRVFTPEEQEEGKDFVIVLSHGLWQRRFAGDPNVVGRQVQLNSRNYTVVGVMEPDFRPLPTTLVEREGQFYRPVAEGYDNSQRSARHLRAIARLKPGVTLAQATAEVNVLAQRLENEHPTTNRNQGANVVAFTEDTIGDSVQRTLWLVFGAVCFVLLIACANVANLLLARSTTRQKEMTIKAAIGAGRAQLIRQLLTESLLLALMGGGLGLLFAIWGTGIVETAGARINPLFADINIDGRCLLFTLLVSVLTGLLFGLGPALQASKLNLAEKLNETGRGSGGLARRNRMRGALVISEVALTLVLLVCAGLLIRTMLRLKSVETGFNSENVLAMDIGLPNAKYPDPKNIVAFYAEATERVAVLPGVKAAGITSVLPLSSNFDGRGLAVEDHPKPRGEEISVDLYVATPGYLQAMEIPVLHGRQFARQDTSESVFVALINNTMAEELWPNQDPIGRRIKFPDFGSRSQPWRTIVGVVSDVAHYALDKKPPRQIYLPHSQLPFPFETIVVKTSGEPTAMVDAVRREILAIDKDQAVDNIRTLAELQSQSVSLRRMFMMLLVGFATLALVLAAVGIYGVMSYAVVQRTQEIGIRMALGARAMDVLLLMVKNGMVWALAGVGVGLFCSFALTRFLAAVLFGVSATDATTFAVVAVAVLAIAFLACYIPARRATKLDPLVALRYD